MIKPWRILGRRLVYAAPPFIEVSVETVALPDGRVIDNYHHIEEAERVELTREEIRAAMRSDEILSLGHAAPLAFFLLEEAAQA